MYKKEKKWALVQKKLNRGIMKTENTNVMTLSEDIMMYLKLCLEKKSRWYMYGDCGQEVPLETGDEDLGGGRSDDLGS